MVSRPMSVSTASVGDFDSEQGSNTIPSLSSYINALLHPAGVFQQTAPGLLGTLLYRNRFFTHDLIKAFAEKCRYTELGEAAGLVFESINVITQNNYLQSYKFTSQYLPESKCIVVIGNLVETKEIGPESPSLRTPLFNLSVPLPEEPDLQVTAPPQFIQSSKKKTARAPNRPFLSIEEIETSPFWKSDAERTAQAEYYQAFLATDWASGPMGPMDLWPDIVKTTTEWVMACPEPTLLIWGPNWTGIFNLAYARTMFDGSSAPLGSDVRVTFGSAVLEALGGVLDEAIDGHVYHAPDRFLALAIEGKMQEYWMTLDYFPVRDLTGKVGGFISLLSNQTEQVINARRIRSLHELVVQVNGSQTPSEVCRSAAAAMCTNSRDVLSAYVYSADTVQDASEGPTARRLDLVAQFGRQNLTLEALPSVDLNLEEDGTWRRLCTEDQVEDPESFLAQLSTVLKTSTPSHLSGGFASGTLKQSDVEQPVMLIPLSKGDDQKTPVIIVLELNPMLPYDQAYSDYIDTMCNALNARLVALQSEHERLRTLRAAAELERQRNDELEQTVKQRMLEARDAQMRFAAAFEASPAGLWILDPQGNILYQNEQQCSMIGSQLGMPQEEWEHLIHPEDREKFLHDFQNGTFGAIDGEYRVLTHTDMTIAVVNWVHIRGGPTYDADGQVVLISGSMVDISDRKERERLLLARTSEAEMMQQRQEYFVDMISHELRNPLGAIDLAVDHIPYRLRDLAVATEADGKRVEEIISDIDCLNIACAHMRRLIDDVLSLSKLDGDLLHITPKSCEPLQCVKEVLLTFKAEFTLVGIKCHMTTGEGFANLKTPHLVMDSARTQQVIINLLSNAIKYIGSAEDPTVTLHLDATFVRPEWPTDDTDGPTVAEGGKRVYLIFSVTDTGPGMQKHELSKLFQRFSQVEPVFSIRAGGSGLGLFICKRLTRLMGGAIRVQSTQGKGSTFSFFIEATIPTESDLPVPDMVLHNNGNMPVSLMPVTNELDAKAIKKQLQPSERCVLVVEDNKINQRLIVKQLKRAGYTILTADDGVQALQQISKSEHVTPGGYRIDVILMDVEMPHKDGLESTRELRQMSKTGELRGWIPIIGVSANVRDAQVTKMLEAGMDTTVGKPFKMFEVVDKMNEMADKWISPH